MRRQSIQHLIELIGSVGMGLSDWNDVVIALEAAFPGSFVMLFGTRGSGQQNATFSFTGLDENLISDYNTHFGAINPWNPFWVTSPVGQSIRTLKVRPASTLRKTEFFEDFLERLDGRHDGIGVKLHGDTGVLVNLACHLPNSTLERTEGDLARVLTSVSASMVAAAQASALLANRLETASVTAALVDRNSDLAFVVDKDLRLKGANDLANAAIGKGGLASGRQDQLRLGNDGAQSWLRQAISALANRRPLDNAFFLFRHEAGSHRMSVLRLPDMDGNSLLLARGLYLVQIRDLSAAAIGDKERLLSTAFGLSRSEIRVCRCLAENMSIRQTAEHLAVSDETIRTHLKRVFAKTNTNRQSELVSLLVRLAM